MLEVAILFVKPLPRYYASTLHLIRVAFALGSTPSSRNSPNSAAPNLRSPIAKSSLSSMMAFFSQGFGHASIISERPRTNSHKGFAARYRIGIPER